MREGREEKVSDDAVDVTALPHSSLPPGNGVIKSLRNRSFVGSSFSVTPACLAHLLPLS